MPPTDPTAAQRTDAEWLCPTCHDSALRSYLATSQADDPDNTPDYARGYVDAMDNSLGYRPQADDPSGPDALDVERLTTIIENHMDEWVQQDYDVVNVESSAVIAASIAREYAALRESPGE